MKFSQVLLVLFVLLAVLFVAVHAQEDDNASIAEDVDIKEASAEVDEDVPEFTVVDDEPVDNDEDIPVFDDDERDEQQQDGIFPSPDVQTSFLFPEIQNSMVPSGKKSKILLGFSNKANKPMTVHLIRGFIVSPMDWNYFIQNCTGLRYSSPVDGEQTGTFVYEFQPDKRLEPRDYGLIMQVYYTNEDNYTFASTFFNQTIFIVESESAFDAQRIFLYLTVVGVIALIAFFVFFRNQNDAKKNESKTSSSTTVIGDLPAKNTSFIDKSIHAQFLNKKKRAKSPKKKKRD